MSKIAMVSLLRALPHGHGATTDFIISINGVVATVRVTRLSRGVSWYEITFHTGADGHEYMPNRYKHTAEDIAAWICSAYERYIARERRAALGESRS